MNSKLRERKKLVSGWYFTKLHFLWWLSFYILPLKTPKLPPNLKRPPPPPPPTFHPLDEACRQFSQIQPIYLRNWMAEWPPLSDGSPYKIQEVYPSLLWPNLTASVQANNIPSKLSSKVKNKLIQFSQWHLLITGLNSHAELMMNHWVAVSRASLHSL